MASNLSRHAERRRSNIPHFIHRPFRRHWTNPTIRIHLLIPRCRDRDSAGPSTVKPTAQLEGSEHRWEPRTNHYSPQAHKWTHKWTHKRDSWVHGHRRAKV